LALSNARLKVACGHFMKDWVKSGGIFSADERDFDAALLGDCPIKLPCGFDGSKAAT
jgi:hypothetical protein